MGKSKATPICPYVFHLYHLHELLLPAEKKEYRIQEALAKHNMESEEDEIRQARLTRIRRKARTTRTNVRVSHPVRSGKSRSRKRPGSRNRRSTGGNNRQHQRIRSPAKGRAQRQWMRWSETIRPLRSLAGRSGQESVNGRL